MRNINHHVSNAVFKLSQIIGEIVTEDITISELATLVENRILIETYCEGNIIRIGHPEENNLEIIFESVSTPLRIRNINIKEGSIITETYCEPIRQRLSSSNEVIKMCSSCMGRRSRIGRSLESAFVLTSSCEPKVARYTKLKDLIGVRLCDLEGKTIQDVCERNN